MLPLLLLLLLFFGQLDFGRRSEDLHRDVTHALYLLNRSHIFQGGNFG